MANTYPWLKRKEKKDSYFVEKGGGLVGWARAEEDWLSSSWVTLFCFFFFFMRRVIVVLRFARFVPLLLFALRSLPLHCFVAQ